MGDTRYNAITLCFNIINKGLTTALINGNYTENFLWHLKEHS